MRLLPKLAEMKILQAWTFLTSSQRKVSGIKVIGGS